MTRQTLPLIALVAGIVAFAHSGAMPTRAHWVEGTTILNFTSNPFPLCPGADFVVSTKTESTEHPEEVDKGAVRIYVATDGVKNPDGSLNGVPVADVVEWVNLTKKVIQIGKGQLGMGQKPVGGVTSLGIDLDDLHVGPGESVGFHAKYFTGAHEHHVKTHLSTDVDLAVTACCSDCPVPLHWWSGDDDARDVIGDLEGTLVGGASIVDGRCGRAFGLDGDNDAVDLSPHAAALNRDAPVTVEAWIRPAEDSCQNVMWFGQFDPGPTDGANPNAQLIASIGDGCTVALDDEMVTVALRRYDGTVYVVGRQGTGTDRNLLFDGGWHHLAVVFDGTHAHIYFDRVEQPLTVGVGNDDGSFGAIANPQSAYIGAIVDSIGPRSFFHGEIDDVRFHAQALTANQLNLDCAAPGQ